MQTKSLYSESEWILKAYRARYALDEALWCLKLLQLLKHQVGKIEQDSTTIPMYQDEYAATKLSNSSQRQITYSMRARSLISNDEVKISSAADHKNSDESQLGKNINTNNL